MISCSQEHVNGEDGRTSTTIAFSAVAGGATRLTGEMTNSTVNSDGNVMRVWGYKSSSETTPVFSDLAVTYNTSTGWVYQPLHYWDVESNYYFYAVMPSTANVTTAPEKYTDPTQGFTITDIPALQPIESGADYMVASRVEVTAPGTGKTVEFKFNHILSKFNVLARCKVPDASKYKVTLNSMSVNFPAEFGTATYTQTTPSQVTSYATGLAYCDAWELTNGVGVTSEPIVESPLTLSNDNYVKLPHTYLVAPTRVTTGAKPYRTRVNLTMDISYTLSYDANGDGDYTDAHEYTESFPYTNISLQDLHNFTQGYITNLYVLLDMSQSGPHAIYFSVHEMDEWNDCENKMIDAEGYPFGLTATGAGSKSESPALCDQSTPVRIPVTIDNYGNTEVNSTELTYTFANSQGATFYDAATAGNAITAAIPTSSFSGTSYTLWVQLPSNADFESKEYTINVTTNAGVTRPIIIYQAPLQPSATFKYNGTALTLDANNKATFVYVAGVPITLNLVAGGIPATGVKIEAGNNSNDDMSISYGGVTKTNSYGGITTTNDVTIETSTHISVYTITLLGGTGNGVTYTLTQKGAGAISSLFTVSSGKRVYFAQGNLQYVPATGIWSFHTNQYDMCETVNGTSTRYGDANGTEPIDLIGWGASGYNGVMPYLTSGNYYYNGRTNLTETAANYDAGYYNAISNGGNKAGMWRLPSGDEWNYLLSSRTNATNLRGKATVNGTAGLVLLPDSWSLPAGLAFSSSATAFTTNTYTLAQWTTLQNAGAVFLPATGARSGTTLSQVNAVGNYYSSTYNATDRVYVLNFSSSTLTRSAVATTSIGSLRLVQDE